MKPYDSWSDTDCISSFIEYHLEDFTYWCSEQGIVKDDYPKHELRYCERYKAKFIDFGKRYEESLLEEEADRKNDEIKAEK